MAKIAVVYWTSTGNTEMMANAIAGSAGADVFDLSSFTAADIANYDKIAFGCPAMGDEVLEEGEFEPFFAEAESLIGGKKVALFGSYGWGDGQWMRDWEDRTKAAGAELFGNGLIINNTPDDDGIAECEAFGKDFAAF
ncbi:MAG: flavodoxin [Clostridiales bacterium]|nr:flavodoxin [Clostridiales bacterium]